MNYQNYEKSIILKYKVKLNGWPNTIKFANPSHISTVDEICLLRHAVQSRTCQWVQLLNVEYAEYMDNVMQQEQSGQTRESDVVYKQDARKMKVLQQNSAERHQSGKVRSDEMLGSIKVGLSF